MRIQVEPSSIFATVSGLEVRVWNGITEDGVQCFLLGHRVAFRPGDAPGGLEAELIESPMPIIGDLRSMR